VGRPDILKWPAYQGAELLEQVSLSGSELRALADKVPAEERQNLREIKSVAVVTYRLPRAAPLKNVIAFYEPRVLAAGYKILSKDLSEAGEAVAAYTGPKETLLVLTAENAGEGGRTLEIVSVEGPLSSLASMGMVRMKAKGEETPKASAGAPSP
jgi:hypothetical protein